MENALVRVEGFKKLEADVKTQTAVVTYDPAKTSPEKLAQAVTDGTEFEASVRQP